MDLITLKNSGGTTLQSHDYGHDGASRVDQHKIGSVTTTYAFDGAGQLTSESRTGYSATYAYDDNYNRTSRTVGGTTHTYAYDAGDKLQTVKVGATTIRSYGYDAAGQTTSMTDSSGTTNLVWDDDARLTSLTPPGSSAQTNAYNALGTRVAAGTRSFARDGTGVTSAVLRDGLADYTPGISERRSGNDRFLSSDLSNTDVQTLAAGGASSKRTYDAFGKVVSSTGTWNGPTGYGGAFGYQEDGNGLSLLGHRWYDAEVGRFLTRDPAKDGRNWYAYCGNDPVSEVDPSGLDADKAKDPFDVSVKYEPWEPPVYGGGGNGNGLPPGLIPAPPVDPSPPTVTKGPLPDDPPTVRFPNRTTIGGNPSGGVTVGGGKGPFDVSISYGPRLSFGGGGISFGGSLGGGVSFGGGISVGKGGPLTPGGSVSVSKGPFTVTIGGNPYGPPNYSVSIGGGGLTIGWDPGSNRYTFGGGIRF